MSDTLDWNFELDGDTSGADRLLATLDRLNKTMASLDTKTHDVDKTTRAAGEGHRKHEHDAKGLSSALEKVTHNFEHMFETVAEWKAIEWLMDLPRKVFQLGEEALVTAAKTERTAKAFGLLFGGAEGKENVDYLEQIAKYTEFTDDNLKSAAISLGKVGFKGDGLDRALAAAQDMAAFSANPEEGFSSALASLERIKRTGRVDNRVLGGLGIGEKDFFAELAVRTGKSADSLKKAMDKGTLDTEDAIETLYTMITRKTGKDLGDAGVEMSRSMTAVLTHLKDLPDQYFQKLADSRGFLDFKDQLSKLLEDLDPDSPNGKRIFSALETAFDAMGALVKSIDLAGVIKDGTEALAQFERGLLVVLSMLPGERGVRATHELIAFDNREDARQQKAANDAEFARRGQLNGTTGDFERAASAAKTQEADDLSFLLPGRHVAKGFGRGIQKEIADAKDATNALAEASVDQLRDTLQIQSPSKVFDEMGRMSGAGYSRGLKKSMEDAYSVGVPQLTAGAGGRGPMHVSITVPVSVGAHGGDTGAQIEEFRMRLRSILPTEIIPVLEQMAMEGGG